MKFDRSIKFHQKYNFIKLQTEYIHNQGVPYWTLVKNKSIPQNAKRGSTNPHDLVETYQIWFDKGWWYEQFVKKFDEVNLPAESFGIVGNETSAEVEYVRIYYRVKYVCVSKWVVSIERTVEIAHHSNHISVFMTLQNSNNRVF